MQIGTDLCVLLITESMFYDIMCYAIPALAQRSMRLKLGSCWLYLDKHILAGQVGQLGYLVKSGGGKQQLLLLLVVVIVCVCVYICICICII